jgi:hypothetical protein
MGINRTKRIVMGTICGIDISFQNDKNSYSGFGGNRDRFGSKMPPPKPIYPWFRSEAAEN